MSQAPTLVRQARARSGVSQTAAARRAGLPQSALSDLECGRHDPKVGTLERVLRSLGCRLALLPTTRRTVAEAAAAVRSRLEAGDHRRAYRELIQLHDDLGSEALAVLSALAAFPPEPTGDARYDAFIAALVEHHLKRRRLPIPGWVSDPDRTLVEDWIVDELAGSEAADATPPAFRRHGIVIHPDELASV